MEDDFPKYGNNDDRVDQIAASWLPHTFMSFIEEQPYLPRRDPPLLRF